MCPMPNERLSRLGDLGFVEVTTPPVAFDRQRAHGGAVALSGARPAIGTMVGVTAVGTSVMQAETAIGAAFDELDRLTGIFSRYDPASALSALNDAGRLLGPPPELALVVRRAAQLHAATAGAFDVTVKPVLDLLAARFPASPPSAAELSDAVARVGARRVRVGRAGIRFDRGDTAVTLDGIAKGYIADRMGDALERHGVKRFLIDTGGDIRARGLSGRNRPWVIGVRNPTGGPEFPDVIALSEGAVATSGGYERFYDPDGRYHHIVSPWTGRSPRDLASVSVVAPDALTADALATALLVLGAEPGLRLIDRLPRCAALVLDPNGSPRPSRRWTALRARAQEGTPA